MKSKKWYYQKKNDIYDAVNDWHLHKFKCQMKDGTFQIFFGVREENCNGEISTHIDGSNEKYDNVDDIVMWYEI